MNTWRWLQVLPQRILRNAAHITNVWQCVPNHKKKKNPDTFLENFTSYHCAYSRKSHPLIVLPTFFRFDRVQFNLNWELLCSHRSTQTRKSLRFRESDRRENAMRFKFEVLYITI